MLRQLDYLSWQHLSVIPESSQADKRSPSRTHPSTVKEPEVGTDLAPMDWKLHDSDDTTHPSVSCSADPKPKVQNVRLIIDQLTF